MSIVLALCEAHSSVISLPDGTYTDASGNPLEVTEQIQVRASEIEAAEASTQYQRDRVEAYPSIGEQLDYIYHNGIDAWKTDMIDPVKAQYPKPTQEAE